MPTPFHTSLFAAQFFVSTLLLWCTSHRLVILAPSVVGALISSAYTRLHVVPSVISTIVSHVISIRVPLA